MNQQATHPNLSILIITYNRVDDTLALLENLASQVDIVKYVGEIILLNNASSLSYKTIEKYLNVSPLPMKFLEEKTNLGVARGRNHLIGLSEFPFLLVLDDDVVFEQADAIKNIATLFNKPQYIENNTAVITLNIFYYDTGKRQQTALPHKCYNEYRDKPWFLTYYFTGAAHLMKRELFYKTGYYPKKFFYGMEEYDLSYRIIDAGYTLAYDSTVKILHKESPLGRMPTKEKLKMMWYNKTVVAWRYLPKKYFYSTTLMWSLFYLKKTRFDFFGWWSNLRKTLDIRNTVDRRPISAKALSYLKRVKARLWY